MIVDCMDCHALPRKARNDKTHKPSPNTFGLCLTQASFRSVGGLSSLSDASVRQHKTSK